MRLLAAFLICLLFSGCIVLQPRAENPFPNMTTIAVVPFFNQSGVPGEINDLGRTFGKSYAIELQKVPGYDVLPLGVVETAIIENDIQFRDEQDALRLAKILDVDAVVIGTITTYNPWYPPVIGMKVNWYSPKNWTIMPDQPCGPCDESQLDENGRCPCDVDWPKLRTKANNSIIRGQSAAPLFEYEAEPLFGHDSDAPIVMSAGATRANGPMTAAPHPLPRQPIAVPRFRAPYNDPAPAAAPLSPRVTPAATSSPVTLLHPVAQIPLGEDPAQYGRIVRNTPQALTLANQAPLAVLEEPPTIIPAAADSQMLAQENIPLLAAPDASMTTTETSTDTTVIENVPLEPVPLPPELLPAPGVVIEIERDNTKPVMSYTRVFDGKDENVVSLLRDYVEITGDKRSGGWEGYMQRTDDYIEFCCHFMIIDMLSLHGGALKTKVWLKLRKNP